MTSFEIYNLFLCIVVFTGFTVLFGVLLAIIVKSSLKAINHGLEDDKIKTEYKKAGKIAKSGVIDFIISLVFTIIVVGVFIFSTVVGYMPDRVKGKVPTLRVVNSGSMAKKLDTNEYLFENNLNDQFQTFDLIFTYKLPDEKDLEVYDIVVYEVDGIMIIHRIVAIEEPNENHPNERYFLLQGDAVTSPDRFPVKYDQMRAIYTGKRLPLIGSFVSFMQSPAGMMCFILILFYMVATPIIEKKFVLAKENRYQVILELEKEQKKKNKKPELWFTEKIKLLPEEMLRRYKEVRKILYGINGIEVTRSIKHETYRFENNRIAKITIKSNMVHVYFALKPEDYHDSPIIFKDVSQVKTHSTYPMCISLSSQGKIEVVKDAILELAREGKCSLKQSFVKKQGGAQ